MSPFTAKAGNVRKFGLQAGRDEQAVPQPAAAGVEPLAAFFARERQEKKALIIKAFLPVQSRALAL
jgi:hypothetical protein